MNSKEIDPRLCAVCRGKGLCGIFIPQKIITLCRNRLLVRRDKDNEI